MTHTRPLRLAFLLFPQFSMMAFSAALEPLRAANRLVGRDLYRWTLVSPDGGAVTASSGIPIAVQGTLDALEAVDMLVVCIGLDPLQFEAYPRLRGQLRQLASRGCQVGGVSGGPFLLAEAGLLDGRRCTVHWEYADFFASRYPRARLTQDVFVFDRGVFTCSGGTAALDLVLHFIREQHGADLALSVAEQFIHPRIRDQDDRQRMTLLSRYRINNRKLATVIGGMEKALAEPAPLTALAAQVGLSSRQVERLFRQYIGASPGEFYLGLRLDRARSLLRETSQSVRAIAIECGFASTSHFSSAYRRRHGHTPTAERRARRSPSRHEASFRRKRTSVPKGKIR